jgi:hypothetical protein
MTTNIATVTPQASVEECFDVMEDREIRRVLVVDEQGKCCGIVAQADIVQSGANPIRTNKVIREISESEASPNRRISGERRINKLTSSIPSLTSKGSVLPILIAVGSGVALTYWFKAKQKSTSQRDYTDNLNLNVSESSYTNATNQESFGNYVDAEQKIENRQDSSSVKAFQTQPNVSSIDLLELPSIDGIDDDTLITEEKGRSASQG